MRAIICNQYGPPSTLVIRDVPLPNPKCKEVLVKIHARSVSSGDCRVRGLAVPHGMKMMTRLVLGFNAPRNPILGADLAGEIVSVGEKVKRFKVGDRVFAMNGMSMGSYADYKCIKEDAAIAHIPQNLSYEQAASIPFGGSTAWDFLLRRCKLQQGERILINGASGAVGTAALQISKLQNAHVTGVSSTGNLDLLRSLGADEVIDYTKSDFKSQGLTYDVILDTVGNLNLPSCRLLLNSGGRLVLLAADLGQMLKAPWQSVFQDKKVIVGTASERSEDLEALGKLASEGKLLPCIDRIFAFDDIVKAHSYVETGRKRGNVIISV